MIGDGGLLMLGRLVSQVYRCPLRGGDARNANHGLQPWLRPSAAPRLNARACTGFLESSELDAEVEDDFGRETSRGAFSQVEVVRLPAKIVVSHAEGS